MLQNIPKRTRQHKSSDGRDDGTRSVGKVQNASGMIVEGVYEIFEDERYLDVQELQTKNATCASYLLTF